MASSSTKVRFRFEPRLMLASFGIAVVGWLGAVDQFGWRAVRWYAAGGATLGLVSGVVFALHQIRRGWLPKPPPAAERRAHVRRMLPLAFVGIGVTEVIRTLPVSVQEAWWGLFLSWSAAFLLCGAIRPVLPVRDVRGPGESSGSGEEPFC